MAESNVQTSELNQDSLEGSAAPVSDVESPAVQVEKDAEESSAPLAKEEDGVAEVTEAPESEAVQSEAVQSEAAQPEAEEVLNQDAAEVHQNGNAEADSTEVEATAEKRKSLEAEEVSPKKARVEEEEPSAEVATNGEEASA